MLEKSSSCNIVKILETRSAWHKDDVEFLPKQGAGPVRTELASRGHPDPRLRPGSECGLARGHPPTSRRTETRRTETRKGVLNLRLPLCANPPTWPGGTPNQTPQCHQWTALLLMGLRPSVLALTSRVVDAYWNGAVARSIAGPSCWAIVRATNRLNKSPATMPRIPPLAFCSAVNLPMRRTLKISLGQQPSPSTDRCCGTNRNPGDSPEQLSNGRLSCLMALLLRPFWHISNSSGVLP